MAAFQLAAGVRFSLVIDAEEMEAGALKVI